MDKICTLIAIPSEIIEGSTYAILKSRSKGACHDGINMIFKDHDENAVDPIIASDLLPDFENNLFNEDMEPIGPSYIDELVKILGPILYDEDRTRPVHIFKSILSQLYRHPVYQAFIEENNPTPEEEI